MFPNFKSKESRPDPELSLRLKNGLVEKQDNTLATWTTSRLPSSKIHAQCMSID
jgi:hypothetical protein